MCIRDRIYTCHLLFDVQLAHHIGPVSYTHLDVYKRQGLGIAKAFAAQGHNIVFNGLEPNGAEIAQQVADEFGIQHLFSPANMLQPDTIKAMIAEAEACLLYTSRCV